MKRRAGSTCKITSATSSKKSPKARPIDYQWQSVPFPDRLKASLDVKWYNPTDWLSMRDPHSAGDIIRFNSRRFPSTSIVRMDSTHHHKSPDTSGFRSLHAFDSAV